MVKFFIRCQQGATAIEYALICGCIFLAIVGGLSLVSSSTKSSYEDTSGKVQAAMGE